MNQTTIQFSVALRAVSLIGVLGLIGCGDDDEAAPVATSLSFDVQVNQKPFACGETYAGVGALAADFTISDARFYVSNVELLDKGGKAHALVLDENSYQSKTVALIDPEDGCGPDGTEGTHTVVTGKAAGTSFSAVRFTLGIPKEQNFIDLASATAPLDVTGMFWTWQSGYKFLKVDGSSPAAEGGINPFFVHLGSGGCPGTNPSAPPTADCSFPNRVTYELAGFSPGQSKVVADLGSLLKLSDVSSNTEGTPPGCMSSLDDPECETLFPRLGIDGPGAQQFFRVQ